MKSATLRYPCVLLALFATTAQAFGTWSLVAINRATGEVGIAAATCLEHFHLRRYIAVVRVGEGVAAAQASVSGDIGNRFIIWSGLEAGSTPAEILAALAAADSAHQTRQYGIAGFAGPPVTFTGTITGEANPGVVGRMGDFEYAIQGNVLAGDEVVLAAEQAFVGTMGDMGQRLMAGMEAARSFGGDGRCSCDESAPDSCGAPPPNFTKSCHTAFVLVARMGDEMGVCTSGNGCANGSYYLWRTEIGGAGDPDPVPILQRKYDAWRQSLAGVPDQILTEVVPGAERLVADGLSSTLVTVTLRDVDGAPVGHGGQTLAVVQTSADPPVALAGPVTDHGDGTHTFALTATTDAGPGSWRIVVQAGAETVQLHPELALVVDPVSDLHVGYDTVSATAAPHVPFVLNLGAAEAGRAYQLLGSASGTQPGTPWSGGLVLPLNWDRLLFFTLGYPNSRYFPGSAGVLDAAGRAEPSLEFPTVAFAPFIGGRFDFCGVLAGTPDAFTAVTGFDVAP